MSTSYPASEIVIKRPRLKLFYHPKPVFSYIGEMFIFFLSMDFNISV